LINTLYNLKIFKNLKIYKNINFKKIRGAMTPLAPLNIRHCLQVRGGIHLGKADSR